MAVPEEQQEVPQVVAQGELMGELLEVVILALLQLVVVLEAIQVERKMAEVVQQMEVHLPIQMMGLARLMVEPAQQTGAALLIQMVELGRKMEVVKVELKTEDAKGFRKIPVL